MDNRVHLSSGLPPSCLYCLVEEVFLFSALESTLSSFSLPGGSVTVLSSVVCMCPSISFFSKCWILRAGDLDYVPSCPYPVLWPFWTSVSILGSWKGWTKVSLTVWFCGRLPFFLMASGSFYIQRMNQLFRNHKKRVPKLLKWSLSM